MKRKLFSITSLLIVLCTVGCARNDVNNNDIAYRNQNNISPNRVTDNIPNRTTRVNNVNNPNNNTRLNNVNNQNDTTRLNNVNNPNDTTRLNNVNNPNNTARLNNVNNPNDPTRFSTINDPNRNRQNIQNNNRIVNNNNNNSRMRVANQAAQKVSDMNEVDTANIIVTNNNAYAAVKLAPGQSLTNKVETEISMRVKSVDRGIDRVYISANPDFYQHMRGYADDLRAGKPITGLFSQFSKTVSRIFPDAK